MVSCPTFEVVPIGGNCHAVNDRNKTVATITSQGSIDWLLKSPMDNGELVRSLKKETHLGLVQGLKFQLDLFTPATRMVSFVHCLEDGGAKVTLVANCVSLDGLWASRTAATLFADAQGIRYEWKMETVVTSNAAEPVSIEWIEFNNVYPGFCGRCMLYTPRKKYRSTFLRDREGIVWEFPHQHLMHYTPKITRLHFAPGSLAGFFGQATGSPVVITHESPFPPDWAICDMYYDLHCGARVDRKIAPGEHLRFRYSVKYLSNAESEKLRTQARPVIVTEEDRRDHDYPRLELGLNGFLRAVNVGAYDDASGFRQSPPVKVWDRQVGHTTKGSLRITNDKPEVTVWSAEPPSEIPSGQTLNIKAMVKTEDVQGRGLSLRLRYYTFDWHPQPHVIWVRELESVPVSGMTEGWVKVSVPALVVPEEHFDYLIQFDVILDGEGVAWVTDIDVDLQPTIFPPPFAEEGSSNPKKAFSRLSPATSGTA